MTEEEAPNEKRMIRRLYTLLPKQCRQLEALAKQAGISQSHFLRELISTAYVERILQNGSTKYYGQSKFHDPS